MAAAAPTEAIRLEHVTFRYAGQEEPALADVCLSVARGEMVVVMGATGAGKSTLAKCLNRTIPAFQSGSFTGSVALFGACLEEESVADLAGAVGLVSQDFEAQLFATNVVQEVVFGLEQLGVPRDEMRRRVPEVLEVVGLLGFEKRDPTTLSGGEKQRLAIAATLALQPQILVFDEPTTDLDPVGKIEIFTVLATMRRAGYTLLVIEHESAAAEYADRVVVLSRGRVVADDRADRVLAQVHLLEEHGVRPPDLARISQRYGLEPALRSVEEAESALLSLVARTAGRGTAFAAPVQALGGTEENDDAGDDSDSEPALLRLEGVDFGYEPQTQTLAGICLVIRAGEFIALIGQNGSGKTTLAKLLNGLLRPRCGRVLLAGRDIADLPLNRVAADVGYVFQNPDHQIFAASVADEVAFGPRNLGLDAASVEQRVDAALDAVGLAGCEGEDPFLLGKGQRQRLAVASMLALRPRVLILDEPTTGLDYSEQVRMMRLIAALHRDGMTVVMITHSPWVVAEYAQRGILLHRGAVQFDGPLRGLFEQEDLLARARFRIPDVTRLGRRLGFTPLSVEELVAGLGVSSRSASQD